MKRILLKAFKSSKDIESYFQDKIAVKALHDRRASVKIAVIDDQPFAPHFNLMNHNYKVTSLGDISSLDMVKPYDIILCDILGVGLSFNDTLQGASLIAEIKKLYPDKWVIAYTGATLNSAATREAKLFADAVIKKDIDIREWVQKLDYFVDKVLNPHVVWSRLRSDLTARGVCIKDIILLEDAFAGAVLKGKDGKSSLKKAVDAAQIPDDARNIINGLLSSALFSLITGGASS